MNSPGRSRRLVAPHVLGDALVHELLAARLVGILATFDRVHGIHAVPMWFAADDEGVVLATGSGSRKIGNLELDRRATFVVHDSRSGFEVCGASLTGRVEILRGPAAHAPIRRVHRRYVSERGEDHDEVREFLASDDLALRLRPETALTWDERGSGASEALRRIGGALPLASTEPRA